MRPVDPIVSSVEESPQGNANQSLSQQRIISGTTRQLATVAPDAPWAGSHTIQPGETLNGIARQHGVTPAELMRVNGLKQSAEPTTGTKLKVPKTESARVASAPPPAAAGLTGSIDAPARVASAAKASPFPEPLPSGKFRWPVRGKIEAGFGNRPDGTHNDGINILVPRGTPIVAAESGHVAYAGGEIKGYGNMVLVRHPNGWITAYAHADELLVKAGDVVKRGDVIAKAGTTGAAKEPQLHFELRQGSRPVDPIPHLSE